MITIPIRTRLEPNGVLSLRVPTGLPEAEVDVVLMVQPVTPHMEAWPKGFFDETYGASADEPIERGGQGEFEGREALR